MAPVRVATLREIRRHVERDAISFNNVKVTPGALASITTLQRIGNLIGTPVSIDQVRKRNAGERRAALVLKVWVTRIDGSMVTGLDEEKHVEGMANAVQLGDNKDAPQA